MSQRGQASVEFVAVIPLLAVALAGLLQAVLVGHAAWAVSQAAAAAARASAVGADARAAARSALPGGLERGLRVSAGRDGSVVVGVRAPSLLIDLGEITSRARFEAQS
jgi:hypothetical protein